mmetsp:Transcript_9444/g.23603  ORF Transcript_9444/g.23603 Transcript_9444/m.23603 type:complete len:339 (-) Transcript_9444:719-1735(-)
MCERPTRGGRSTVSYRSASLRLCLCPISARMRRRASPPVGPPGRCTPASTSTAPGPSCTARRPGYRCSTRWICPNTTRMHPCSSTPPTNTPTCVQLRRALCSRRCTPRRTMPCHRRTSTRLLRPAPLLRASDRLQRDPVGIIVHPRPAARTRTSPPRPHLLRRTAASSQRRPPWPPPQPRPPIIRPTPTSAAVHTPTRLIVHPPTGRRPAALPPPPPPPPRLPPPPPHRPTSSCTRPAAPVSSATPTVQRPRARALTAAVALAPSGSHPMSTIRVQPPPLTGGGRQTHRPPSGRRSASCISVRSSSTHPAPRCSRGPGIWSRSWRAHHLPRPAPPSSM